MIPRSIPYPDFKFGYVLQLTSEKRIDFFKRAFNKKRYVFCQEGHGWVNTLDIYVGVHILRARVVLASEPDYWRRWQAFKQSTKRARLAADLCNSGGIAHTRICHANSYREVGHPNDDDATGHR